MPQADGYYVAEADVPEEAVLLAYTFFHEDTVDGVCAVKLTEGVYRYVMSGGDMLENPTMTVYADAGQTREKYAFTVGQRLYPDALAETAGGLEVPVSAVVPVDTNVVSYKAAAEAEDAEYTAAKPGETSFTVTVAGNDYQVSTTVVVTDPPVWLMPQGYELLNGDIYNNGDELQSADDIDTALIIAPGGSNTSLLITSYETEAGDTKYKQIEDVPAAAVESDDKDKFTTSSDKGQVEVKVNSSAPVGVSAAVTCTVSGYEMKNSLTIATAAMPAAMRGIKLYLPESGRPQRYDEDAYDVYVRLTAFEYNNREVDAGTSSLECEVADDKLYELLIQNFEYIQDGNTFVEDMYKVEASVPDTAAKVLVLFELRAKNAADSDYGFVMPAYMIDLSKSLYEEDKRYTENDYVPYIADYFFPLWTAEFATNQTPFGSYKVKTTGNVKTKEFTVGDSIDFNITRMTGSEGAGQGLWTVNVSDVRPLDTSVITGTLASNDLKAAAAGQTFFLGSWFGIKGIVYPIDFRELTTNPSTFSAEPTPITVTE